MMPRLVWPSWRCMTISGPARTPARIGGLPVVVAHAGADYSASRRTSSGSISSIASASAALAPDGRSSAEPGLLDCGRLTAGVDEGLVDDLPRAGDPRQREEVHEGDGPPKALVGEGHRCGVVGLLDGGDLRVEAAIDVDRLAVHHRDQLRDRLVVSL